MATIAKDKLIDVLRNIPKVAERERWVFTRDADEGAVFYSPEQISGDSELHQITDEYALYLDKEYNPKGLVVEYYGTNFIKHHPELEMIDIFDPQSTIDSVIDPYKVDDPKVLAFRSAFENAIISEGIKEPLIDAEPVA